MIGPGRATRYIVPRWRASALIVLSGEADSLSSEVQRPWLDDESELATALDAFSAKPTTSRAVELIGAAILYRKPESGLAAARFVLENGESGEVPRALARRLLAELDPSEPLDFGLPDFNDERAEAQRTIRRLRPALRRNPRNPLGWVDLAHAHASLGHTEEADRSMRVALASSPASRVLLRSASRLYVHRDEPDRAHSLLLRADSVRHDPWLLAAELATASAAGQSPQFARRARQLLRDDSIRPFHLTELASALATLELEAGSTRRARQLFRRSLADPTDNSVAQAEWAANRFGEFVVDEEHLKIRRGYEARARHASSRAEWQTAVDESWNWLKDEPFSTEPAIFGSYVASVGHVDFEESIRLAEAGLLANPDDATLRNNLVFALANLNRLDEAEMQFRRIRGPHEPRVQLTLLATAGLLSYRRGHSSEGRDLYRRAIDLARRIGDSRALSLASTFFAREELLANSSSAAVALQDAIRIASSEQSAPELTRWLALLDELFEHLRHE